jgi:hypothetical protein
LDVSTSILHSKDSAYFDEIKNTTTSGDIRVQNARGNIQATTTDGDISAVAFLAEVSAER